FAGEDPGFVAVLAGLYVGATGFVAGGGKRQYLTTLDKVEGKSEGERLIFERIRYPDAVFGIGIRQHLVGDGRGIDTCAGVDDPGAGERVPGDQAADDDAIRLSYFNRRDGTDEGAAGNGEGGDTREDTLYLIGVLGEIADDIPADIPGGDGFYGKGNFYAL